MKLQEVSDVQQAEKLSCFFVDNIPENYVSSGDVAYGRADASFRLVPDLRQVIRQELSDIIDGSVPNKKVLVGTVENTVIGLAIISINSGTGTIEDLVIDRDARGKGYGKNMLALIDKVFRDSAVTTIFLESGVGNHAAHRFFAGQGFKPAGLLFVKPLQS